MPIAGAAIALVLIGAALYVGGVFGSSGKSRSAASTTPTSSTASFPATTPTPTAPTTSTAPQSSPGPAMTLRTYFQELGSGQARGAFAIMSAAYKEKNPSWVSEREEAGPQINLISVGTASYFSGGSSVPVEFYARDKFPSRGSDTKCRGFSGTITMVHLGSEWRYEPGASHLKATVTEPSNPACP